MKKWTSLLLTLVLLLSCVSAMADDETPIIPATYTITINIPDDSKDVKHTYEAYQIFTGDLSDTTTTDNAAGTKVILSNIKWGSSVTKYQDATVTPETSASEVANSLIDKSVSELMTFVSNLELGNPFKTVDTPSNNTYVIDGLAPGYYLVKDKDASLTGKHDAYTSIILEVVENSTVSPKSVYPTVDKQVWDEKADAETNHEDGWGESADHELNETFQFKLIANLPASTNYDAYETYKLVFHDTMSAGVTFEKINSVTVDDEKITNYTCTATENQPGGSWTLTIADVTENRNVDLTNGAKVIVVYDAHLNENAKIGDTADTPAADKNKNTVYLQYSNNPNATGGGQGGEGGEGDEGGHEELGKTNEDTVWVFTYNLDVTKVDGTDNSKTLSGAKFKLMDANKAKYVTLDNNNKVTGWVAKADNAGTELTTGEDGLIKIIGLDHGTYYLEETEAPAGYNKLDDPFEIEITATHTEDSNGATASTQYEINDGTAITVKNNAGATLPETGGMGTTLLYVGGGILVLAAIVLLIVKRRASAE